MGSSRSFKVRESTVAPDGAWSLAKEDRSERGKPGGLVKGLTVLGESTRRAKIWISDYPKFEVIGLAPPHRLLVPELMSEARPDAFGPDREVPFRDRSTWVGAADRDEVGFIKSSNELVPLPILLPGTIANHRQNTGGLLDEAVV